jgi:hypothetical protein
VILDESLGLNDSEHDSVVVVRFALLVRPILHATQHVEFFFVFLLTVLLHAL